MVRINKLVDCGETFSPVIKQETKQTILGIAIQNHGVYINRMSRMHSYMVTLMKLFTCINLLAFVILNILIMSVY